MTFTMRCPECDIELVSPNGGARWVCPICHIEPRPEQYVHPQPVLTPSAQVEDLIVLRELLVDLVEDLPEHTDVISTTYHQLGERLEALSSQACN